jgi:hypothetical protein
MKPMLSEGSMNRTCALLKGEVYVLVASFVFSSRQHFRRMLSLLSPDGIVRRLLDCVEVESAFLGTRLMK